MGGLKMNDMTIQETTHAVSDVLISNEVILHDPFKQEDSVELNSTSILDEVSNICEAISKSFERNRDNLIEASDNLTKDLSTYLAESFCNLELSIKSVLKSNVININTLDTVYYEFNTIYFQYISSINTLSILISLSKLDIVKLNETITLYIDVLSSSKVATNSTINKINDFVKESTILIEDIKVIKLKRVINDINCKDIFISSFIKYFLDILPLYDNLYKYYLTNKADTIGCKEFVVIQLIKNEEPFTTETSVIGDNTRDKYFSYEPVVAIRFKPTGEYAEELQCPSSSLIYENRDRLFILSGYRYGTFDSAAHYHDIATNTPKLKGNKPSQYHIFNYHSKQWEDQRDVEKAKDDKWKEIKKIRSDKLEEPFDTPYGKFDGDNKAQKNITDAILMLRSLVSAGQPATINFTLYDNSVVTLSSDDMTTVGLYLGYRTQAVYDRARDLRDQITACTSVSEVNAIEW